MVRSGDRPWAGWLGAACAGLGLLLAACGGGVPAAQPQATVPSAATLDPYAVPAKITPAYVQRVLNALETVNGESLRLILSQHAFPAGAAVLLRAINTPDEFQRQTGLWGQEIAQGLKNYKANPGVVHDQLARELSANPQCIFTQVNRDFSAVAVTSPPPHITFIELRSKDPSQDPEHVNPTPWVFAFVGFSSTGGQPADPCAST